MSPASPLGALGFQDRSIHLKHRRTSDGEELGVPELFSSVTRRSPALLIQLHDLDLPDLNFTSWVVLLEGEVTLVPGFGPVKELVEHLAVDRDRDVRDHHAPPLLVDDLDLALHTRHPPS